MKSCIHYIICALAAMALASCAQDGLPVSGTGTGTLALSVGAGYLPRVGTRAADPELVVELYKADGTLYRHFDAGKAPDKIELEAGVVYTVKAYTDNQETWQTANGGEGEACYYGDTTVMVAEDETVYCTYKVPMTNYAVTFSLPELFDRLFTSKTFTLVSGGRTVALKDEGRKAYFGVDAEGFKYQLQATNTDGKTSRHSLVGYPDVEAGKLYNIKYIYSTDLSTGGIEIDITDNTEHEDEDIEV